MSFIKKYLGSVEDIIEYIESSPEQFYNSNIKADAYIGPAKSMELLDEFITAYQEDDKQDFSIIIAKYKN